MKQHANTTGFHLKTWTMAAALLAALASQAGAVPRTVNCLQANTIRSMEQADEQSARVTLRSRAIYLTRFREPCSVTGFTGFTYRTSGALCRGQTVKAVGTGDSRECVVGNFVLQRSPGR
jgi:hypothetical protein